MKKKKPVYRKEDFTEKLLPPTRFAQFGDLFTHEWRTILLMGLMCFLFALPYFAKTIFEFMILSGTASSFSDTMSEAEKNAILFARENVFNFIDIPCFMIFSFALMGNARVLKEMCWGNGTYFRGDFFRGIRENVRLYLPVSFVLPLVIALLKYASGVLSGTDVAPIVLSLLKGVGYGVLFALLIPTVLFSLSIYNYYSLPLWKNMVNSFRFFVHRFLFVFPFLLALFGIFMATLIPDYLILVLVMLVLVFFAVPLFQLSFRLFALSQFDSNLNEKNYPEIYRKGLSK